MPLPVRLKIQEMLWPLCVKNTNPFNSKIATVMYAIDFPRIFPQNHKTCGEAHQMCLPAYPLTFYSSIYLLEIKFAVCYSRYKIIFQPRRLGRDNVVTLAYCPEMDKVFTVLPRKRSDPAIFSTMLLYLLQIKNLLLIHFHSPPCIQTQFVPQHPPR